MTARPRIEAVAVVVPARNEEENLPGALAALRGAPAAVDVAVELLVVLDRCTDASARLVTEAGVRSVSVDLGNVGAARRAGLEDVVERLERRGVSPANLWLATTDADSLVPSNWLTSQIAAADAGADVLVGTVEPDGALPEEHRRAWVAQHHLREGHSHVHGANLGIRASAYLAVGGFSPLPIHEDVDLVQRLAAVPGLQIRATDAHRVITSSRDEGRAPGGFADYLADITKAVQA